MFNADKPTELGIQIFIIVGIFAAIMIAGGSGQGNISKALKRGGVFLVAVCVLGLTGLGAALAKFGLQILAAVGFNVPAA